MENQSYYLPGLRSDNDVCETQLPLQVNCAGYVNLSRPFTTVGKRKDWYLQLVDDGSMAAGDGDMTPGQFILRTPELPYRYEVTEGGRIGYYWVHFTGSWAGELIDSNGLTPERIYRVPEEKMPALKREFGLLFREFMLLRPGHRDMSNAILTSLMVRLGRAVLADGADSESNGLRKRLEHSAACIHSHFTENLSVSALAEMEHLSESRFRDIFRQAFGVSPSEYIIGLRISHGCDLLLTTDLNVSEIAGICGYTDALYFCRLFKKKMGVTPAGYRKNAVGNQMTE